MTAMMRKKTVMTMTMVTYKSMPCDDTDDGKSNDNDNGNGHL